MVLSRPSRDYTFLPPELDGIHNTFHVCYLKKCLAEETNIIPLKELRVDEKQRLVEEPVAILDRKVQQLKNKRVKLVNVQWKNTRGADMTCESEEEMRKKHPHLFDM